LSNMRKVALVVALFLFFCPRGKAETVSSEESPEARLLFSKAQRLVREKNFPEALDTYKQLVKNFGASTYGDIYNYSMARACYFSGDYPQAEQILKNLSAVYPTSSLLAYADHLRGNCAYRMNKFDVAFDRYLRAYKATNDERLKEISEKSLLAMADAGYLPSDSALMQAPSDLQCHLRTRLAYLMAGYWSKEQLTDFMADCPGEWSDKSYRPIADSNHLLVSTLLPMSGPYARFAESIMNGVILAAARLRTEGIHIDVSAYDTQADNVTAARELLALTESDADMIIGPLLSDVAATAAAALDGHPVPLMVPAATQAGFTDLSANCFQMSPNLVTIARGLAQYAVTRRHLSRLAVMSPITYDETVLTDAFVAEAKRLGARIVAVERFRPDETDFGVYIRDIKTAILGLPKDSVIYITRDGDTLEAGEAPIALDAVFIPVAEDQLFLLLPQLDFYRVETSLYLGVDSWGGDKIVRLNERLLKKAVFYSGQEAMLKSSGYEKFATAYESKYGAMPDRLAALGYDAVNLLAASYRQGNRKGADVLAFLRLTKGYGGTSGQITFGKKRSNLEIPLFVIRNGQIKPLGEPLTAEDLLESDIDSNGTVPIQY